MDLLCAIIDDSSTVLSTLKDLLERQGIVIVGMARSSAEAMSLLVRTQPTLALVDIDLGADSGLELCQRIAEHPALATTHCVLTSTHSAADFVDLIEESPAIGFIAKTHLSGDALRALIPLPQRE